MRFLGTETTPVKCRFCKYRKFNDDWCIIIKSRCYEKQQSNDTLIIILLLVVYYFNTLALLFMI